MIPEAEAREAANQNTSTAVNSKWILHTDSGGGADRLGTNRAITLTVPAGNEGRPPSLSKMSYGL